MKQRVFYLDFLRVFAIAMVLALHSINSYILRPDLYGTASWYVNLIINAFARTGVPIFLMISGCLMLTSDKTGNFKQFYKKSLLHILIPLLFWNVAYFVFRCAMGYADFDMKTLLSDLINAGSEYHLWYLYSLVGIYLIAPFLKILVDYCTMRQQLLLLLLMMFGTTIRPFINTVTPVYIYLFDPLFNGYLSCFLMGYILSKGKSNRKNAGIFALIGLICVVVSVLFHDRASSNGGIDLIFNNGYSLPHYFLAASVFVIIKFIFEHKSICKNFIALLSRCSFGIYLVHVAVMELVVRYFMVNTSPILASAYLFAVTFVVSFVISFALSKIKYVKRLVL